MPSKINRERPASVTCTTCRANCCKLEVILMEEDDVPSAFVQVDRWGGHVMARLADGWCAALDRNTMRCAIYARRPGVCRDYEMGGSDCLLERATLRVNSNG
jgi:Fe-S-cluster containining protein